MYDVIQEALFSSICISIFCKRSHLENERGIVYKFSSDFRETVR